MGVLSTLICSWLCSARLSKSKGWYIEPYRDDDMELWVWSDIGRHGRSWGSYEHESLGFADITWQYAGAVHLGTPLPYEHANWGIAGRSFDYAGTTGFDGDRVSRGLPGVRGYEEATGWPMLALRYSYVEDEAGVVRETPGIPVPKWDGWSRTLNVWPGRLPVTPIWSGVVINTVFFGACWFVLACAWRVGWDWRRLRRGVCPHCRYDLRHDFSAGCPECGWRKPKTPAA
ncbi:MAG: hypothetical protein RIB32_00665 [Phycisphaerales bacterium]